ncbi:MAG: hypothetical protein K9M10_02670 [Candidatus Pacebacteria bacterium]|nr:hypothetical protein [Candidatus Paceibacterota bacterium]MCF7857358.1 hypothetical protein [Candidatus Paceibacterota bacterium]
MKLKFGITTGIEFSGSELLFLRGFTATLPELVLASLFVGVTPFLTSTSEGTWKYVAVAFAFLMGAGFLWEAFWASCPYIKLSKWIAENEERMGQLPLFEHSGDEIQRPSQRSPVRPATQPQQVQALQRA